MARIVIDAEGEVRGRVASFTAKNALLGNEVAIVNCEKAIISGQPAMNIADFKKLRALNTQKPTKGPFFSTNPEKMMKRTVRGMLPDFRVGRGKEALRKVKCHIGVPEEFKKEKMLKLKTQAPSKKSMTVQRLSELS